MHQLKGLIWKAYKVRLRSALSTLLDVAGPIIVIIIYLLLKVLLGSLSATIDPSAKSVEIFRNSDSSLSKTLNPKTDLPLHLCNKVLYYSQDSFSDISQLISTECGVELVRCSSRDELKSRLQRSLDIRINYSQEGKDLTRSNLTQARACPSLSNNQSSTVDDYYLAGIVYNARKSFDVYLTEIASGPIIYQPYTQGSSYNEYRLPGSDLNSGYHLLELCLAKATTSSGAKNQDQSTGSRTDSISSLKVRVKSFPLVTSSLIVPILYLVFQLGAIFLNALATVMRVSEDRENGLHHYIRTAGVPASLYWSSQLIISAIHMAIQSLAMAVILAIPTSSVLVDPIHEANITFRWSLLFTYSMAIQTHAMYVGSFFDRMSQAVLCTCLLAVGYCCFPLLFMLQWSPFGYTPLSFISIYMILNPVSNMEALLIVIYGVYMQAEESPNFSQLGMSIQGGGISDWTIGGLWTFLIAQTVFYFFMTIISDHFAYGGTYNPLRLLYSFINDLCFCNSITPTPNSTLQLGQSTSSRLAEKRLDPNRICCSLRQVTIIGPSAMSAHTKGDALKLTQEQLNRWRQVEHTLSNPQQYLVNRQQKSPSSPASSSVQSGTTTTSNQISLHAAEPILLDETIYQHIIWSTTNISLHNLAINFRFNQVTFILGQTDLKELLFAALLGIRAIKSGSIILDGASYYPGSLVLARPHIGYLSERDVFLNEMNIFENLQFFGSLRDSAYSQYDSESHFVLRLLHLTSRRTNLPIALTHRSARKLALAVACVGHTKLLLLVEPTLSLRWKPRCQVLSLLKKYKSIRSIVVDTSDVDEAIAFGDRVVLLKDGQAADLDGTPEKLSRKLCCGYWIVFEPVVAKGSQLKSRSLIESIGPLEKLTGDIFKGDKLEKLDLTKRSVYEELLKSSAPSSKSLVGVDVLSKSKTGKTLNSSKSNLTNDQIHKTTVILKVQSSANSNESICKLLRQFDEEKTIFGFRLSELTYESLEDVIILRMSKAMYPDLPPDLLLSLSQRSQKTESNNDPPLVSVRKLSSDLKIPKVVKPIFKASFREMILDRAAPKKELFINLFAIAISIGIVALGLGLLPNALEPEESVDDENVLEFPKSISNESTFLQRADIERLYKQRLGFYVFEAGLSTFNSTNSTSFYLNRWKHNSKLTGTVRNDLQDSDAHFVGKIIQNSKDLAVAIIFYNPQSNDATIAFEPYVTHAMLAALKTLINYLGVEQQLDSLNNSTSSLSSTPKVINFITVKHIFNQSWHKIIRGHLIRRLIYGMSFAFAEGIAMGALVLAPLRHRTESRVSKVSITYWLAMASFDLFLSCILSIGYVILFIAFEDNYSPYLLTCSFLVLILYKLASIPISYLLSLLVESSFYGYVFVFLAYVVYGWSFSIFFKTFIEWTLFGEGYIYTISIWIMHALPITSLVSSITDINHINHINLLCSSVPAYTATKNLLPLEGIQKRNMIDKLWQKVDECLSNGKSGISEEVLHLQPLGILWDIYLIIVFGLIIWTFLLTSERVFGLIARRFSNDRSSNDPLKTIVRTPESSGGFYKWDREKDRLVSQYIRCMNEVKYVKQMASNCLYLRFWLKPMSDQELIESQMVHIFDPILACGQMRNEIQIELRTTLQIFIRIGNETARCKVNRIKLLEVYSKYVAENKDTITKFAVIDWTRETLYKILLHGHYNTKCISAIT